jgi:hypothetical protein
MVLIKHMTRPISNKALSELRSMTSEDVADVTSSHNNSLTNTDDNKSRSGGSDDTTSESDSSKRVMGATFEVRIASVANQLVGTCGLAEHRACATQICHDRLNRVFELAGVNYQPCPKPIALVLKKRKDHAATDRKYEWCEEAEEGFVPNGGQDL